MPAATIRQCAVLAGGLGTRLGTLAARTPKPILPCDDRPFLAWLLREFLRFGVEEFVLLTGHLSERIRESVTELARTLPRQASIRISEEPVPAGTGGALFYARDMLDERFLLCNGDSLFDCNLAATLAAATADPPTTLGRLVLRRLDDAARYGIVEIDGVRVTAFREKSGVAAAGLINGGIYLLDRRVLEQIGPVCSLERDVLPALAAAGALRAAEATGYFVDIGIPEDLERARRELPDRLRRPALFLDRDGVLNVDYGWVGGHNRREWMPGAIAAVRLAVARGWHVFVVTNQSGVARGYYTEADVQALMDWVAEELRAGGGTLDDWRSCPFHSEAAVDRYRAAHPWRKPQPGMLLDLIHAWGLDPAQALMVGDADSDMQAAAAAGVRGVRFAGGDLAAFLDPLLADHAAGPMPRR